MRGRVVAWRVTVAAVLGLPVLAGPAQAAPAVVAQASFAQASFARDGVPDPAAVIRNLAALLASRPTPRLETLAVVGEGASAVRAVDGAFLLVYSSGGHPFALDTTTVRGARAHGWWFDPVGGTALDLGTVEKAPAARFFPPDTGGAPRDRILVVDDADAGFPVPGTSTPPRP
ncbi:hypothetical protein GCM10009836_70250 [Pseudonocardia ailaonensis]|uniref:Putative collagen-binding domain-containing protein n=1 Tax=Pseudonocardia ailaonensis TaxID=367279 RepID=A0ABN2NP49_9PSEU